MVFRYLNGEGYIGGFEKPQVDELLKEMDKNFTKWAKQFAPFAVMVNNSKAMTEVEHSLGRMNPKIALTVAKMVFLSDLTKLLPKVKTSTSIILTKKDNIVPKSVAFFIKSNIGGNSNVNILKSQGHFPQLTAFPQLLKVLTKVLQLKQYKIINNWQIDSARVIVRGIANWSNIFYGVLLCVCQSICVRFSHEVIGLFEALLSDEVIYFHILVV